MYSPKTGAKCGCRRGVQRDNCPNCEGSGWAIDFHLVRSVPACGHPSWSKYGIDTWRCDACGVTRPVER